MTGNIIAVQDSSPVVLSPILGMDYYKFNWLSQRIV